MRHLGASASGASASSTSTSRRTTGSASRGERAVPPIARAWRATSRGCSDCERALRLWAALLSLDDQGASAPRGLLEWVTSGVALVFDSFRQPQVAGVRASAAPRQLLYKAGRYTIKVQVEPGALSHQFSVLGQILDKGDAGEGVRDVTVVALRGSAALDRTVTNKLGEFHLEADAEGEALQLSVGLPEVGTFALLQPWGTEKTRSSSEGEVGP